MNSETPVWPSSNRASGINDGAASGGYSPTGMKCQVTTSNAARARRWSSPMKCCPLVDRIRWGLPTFGAAEHEAAAVVEVPGDGVGRHRAATKVMPGGLHIAQRCAE